MKDAIQPDCPRTEQLSALLDGELSGAARADIDAHAAACPVCGAMLAELGALHTAFQPLAAERLDLDLAPLVEARLPPRDTARRPTRERSRRPAWQWLGSGAAAAAVLGAGLYMGALLAGGSVATAPQAAAMALFDPVPPGALCIGAPSCY
jgi:anti-sigma factor RsiW